MKWKLGFHQKFSTEYLVAPFGMYMRGIGFFEVELSSRRNSILHRLLNSQLQLVASSTRYLYTSNAFPFNDSFLCMGKHLDEGDHEQSKNVWVRIDSSFSSKKYPNPSLGLLLFS